MISYRETNGHSIQVQMEKEKGWECTQEKEKERKALKENRLD